MISGTAAYPTLTQLTMVGTVMQQPIPSNPYSNLSTVQTVSAFRRRLHSAALTTTYGWNYYVDNSSSPPTVLLSTQFRGNDCRSERHGRVQSVNQL